MDDPSVQKIRILFGDADSAFGVFARYSLEQLGFAVTVVNASADLVARFVPDQFDVVVVSLTTPLFDGLQVLRAIKQASPTTPMILLRDDKTLQLAEEGMQESAFAYFQKPLNDFAQLGYAIRRAHEWQMLHRQVAELRAALALPHATESDAPSTPLRQLVQATLTQPLSITLQMLAAASAHLMQASYGIVKLAQPGAEIQVVSAHGFENLETAARDLAARGGDAFTTRIITERRTCLEAMSSESSASASIQMLGVPLLANDQSLGVLIIYPLAPAPVNAARLGQIETLAAQGTLAIELMQLREENARLTAMDPTTGALKREIFLEYADREFRRSWRYNQPITVIIVDVDNLAEINLRCGRAFGNLVLREVANVCASVVRSIDLVGRYDGDAFALLLLMTASEDAKTVAERLRIGINTIHLADAQGPVQITAALGVCSYPRDGCTSVFDLLAVSQEAQRAARYRGANQILYG